MNALKVKVFTYDNVFEHWEKKNIINSKYGKVIIYNDGMGVWSVRKYEENKKPYRMECLYEDKNITSFLYWLNANIADIV